MLRPVLDVAKRSHISRAPSTHCFAASHALRRESLALQHARQGLQARHIMMTRVSNSRGGDGARLDRGADEGMRRRGCSGPLAVEVCFTK